MKKQVDNIGWYVTIAVIALFALGLYFGDGATDYCDQSHFDAQRCEDQLISDDLERPLRP